MAEELTASKTIDVSAAFKAAEGAMKFAERISCEVVIPAVNQLRYALCHVLEGDDEAAVRHCVRARYDAYEAAVFAACGIPTTPYSRGLKRCCRVSQRCETP